jgi:hypothetical protein
MQAAMSQQLVDVVVLKLSKPFEEDFRTLLRSKSKLRKRKPSFVAQFDDEMLQDWMEVIQRGVTSLLKLLDWEELKHHLGPAIEKHHPVEPRKRLHPTSAKSLSAAGT